MRLVQPADPGRLGRLRYAGYRRALAGQLAPLVLSSAARAK